MAETDIKDRQDYYSTIRARELNEFRQNGQFCDLTLLSNDSREFKVHKVIVSSASEYFKAMLVGEPETKEQNADIITLEKVSGDILEQILTYIYTREIDLNQVDVIIEYAIMLQVSELSEVCGLVLARSLNENNCIKYWRIAKNNWLKKLEKTCLEYICRNAECLFKESSLMDLTEEEVKELFEEDQLKCSEEVLFEFAWRWAKRKNTDHNESMKIFSRVIKFIRFTQMKENFVFSGVLSNEVFLENTSVLKKVAQFTKHKFIQTVTPTNLKFSKAESPRLMSKTKKLLALVGSGIYSGLGKNENPTRIQKKFLPTDFAYTTFDKYYLLISGGNQYSKNCEYLLPSTLEWRHFPRMIEGRMGHSCVCIEKQIYACGGKNSNTVEIFDLGRGNWCSGPELLSTRHNFGTSAVNGSLYVIGGTAETVDILDPRIGKWSTIAVTNRFRSGNSSMSYTRCAVRNSYINCLNANSMYCFDTRMNNFTEEDEISCKSYDLCELNGDLYLAGCKENVSNYYIRRDYELNIFKYGDTTVEPTCWFRDDDDDDDDVDDCLPIRLVSLYY